MIDRKVHAEFTKKLIEYTRPITVGDGMKNTSAMGPVVDKNQFESVLSYIEIGKKELERVKKTKHRLLIGYTLNQLSTGYFFTNDYKTAEKYILEAYQYTKKSH